MMLAYQAPTLQGFTGYVPPFGSGSNGVLLLGEGPGEQEARHSVPFYQFAPAGACLERVLRRIGVSREQFTISNVVWSQPPNNYLEHAPYEAEAVEAYRPLLDDLIARVKPRVIVPMGNVALKRITGYGGKGATITAVRGYVIPSDYRCWVLPTYHPAYIVRGKSDLTGVLIHDIQRALGIARNGFAPQPVHYITHPSLDDAFRFEEEWRSVGCPPLSFDIETPESANLEEEEVEDKTADISYTILRVSFSFRQRHAITLPWMEPFIPVIKRVLSTDSPKRVFNEMFDVPRLEANSCPVNGRIYDVMVLWHHLQPSLPKSLGFCATFYDWDMEPWKHLSDAQPESYSCADADALTRIADGVEGNLRAVNLWDSVERHVIDLTQVLRQMSRNGLPVDTDELGKLQDKLTEEHDKREQALQSLIPEHIKPTHPPKGYKKVPKDTTGMKLITVTDAVKENGEVVVKEVQRWAKVLPFNPESVPQVKEYCKWKLYRLGTTRKTKKETTDEDTLKRLIRKHKDEVLRLVLECRQLTKVLGTYVAGWTPGSDGLVHATPGFWGKMFRISWRRPNLGATIQDKDEEAIAQGFRKCVAPKDGEWLVEGDWVGMEALLVGYFADDPAYMRLSQLGVHSFLLSHMIGEPTDLSWSDADLKAVFKELKHRDRKRYDDAKHATYLTNYGGTPRLISMMYGVPEKAAKEIQGLYFELFPKVRQWQLRTIEQANKQAYLTLPFNYKMWFWDVQRWDSKSGRYVPGEDAKSCLAFVPRDTGAFILRETLLRLRDQAEAGVLRMCVHDSIGGIVPQRDVDSFAGRLKREMEAPVAQLNNLVLPAEIKVGRCWHESAMEVRG